MATKAAHKRLTKEYALLAASPPPYITAHPQETDILTWHYILTGPPSTPYENGQYYGTLTFPSDYPFAPPAIRMHTPSGRFRCSERLCLSISDFHPKSFNPSWSVNTILLGVLSFMTSEEMTTGSIKATDEERKVLAARTRWWNSTGGGSTKRLLPGQEVKGSNGRGFGAIKAGDGGKRFREEWPELDEQNWKWMEERRVDPQTGKSLVPVVSAEQEEKLAGKQDNGMNGRAVAAAGNADEAQGFVRRNALYIVIGVLLAYVLVTRLLSERR